MSIVRILTRYAICEALKGETLAGDSVKDSEINAINLDDQTLGIEESKPFIAVYTDDMKAEFGDNRPEYRENADVSIFIEWGVTSAMGAFDPETGETVLIPGVPNTDREMERQLDITGRQIIDALTCTMAQEEWLGLLVIKRHSLSRARVSGADDGAKMAAHQFILKCDLIDDPIKGQEIIRPIPEILAHMKASDDPANSKWAEVIEEMLQPSVSEAEAYRQHYGETIEQQRAVGIYEVPE